jgi:hypothetical protein
LRRGPEVPSSRDERRVANTRKHPSDLPAFDEVFMTHLLAAEPVVDAIADRL